MSGKKVLSICCAAMMVLFLFSFSGTGEAKKRSEGILIETGCYAGNLPIEVIAELIRKDFFGPMDCVGFERQLGLLELVTAPRDLVELLREFKWSIFIIRGYASTPEEGCGVARRFISALQKVGWKPAIGFQPSCHSTPFGQGVEIFIWNLPE